jgi:DNA-binding transcriptional LysR family regulator
MYIDSLKVFSALADTGSFSRAGETLSISQSAVSQQISALEKKLKVSLLERGGRSGVVLTPEGHVFLHACREILTIYSAIDERLKSAHQNVTGEIRIASIYSIGLHELPPILREFRSAHPDIRVSVDYKRCSQIYAAILAGTADIGLVAFPKRRTGIHVELFGEDELVAIFTPSHPLSQRETITLHDLESARFVSFEPDLPTRKAVDRHLRNCNVSVVQYMEFDNIETVKKAVEVENAVSLVPKTSITKELERGSLIAREITHPLMRRQLGAICKRSALRPPGWKNLLQSLRNPRPTDLRPALPQA